MAAKKNSDKSQISDADSGKKNRKNKGDGTRETIESIAIAFILAFLFKTFQAEAYVIPTGSMAPTLFGRHKEVTCDGCGFKFALGASSELDQESGTLEYRIEKAFCSNCGNLNEVRNAPVFNGDRILVNKQIAEFERFDVVVFKNPEQGHVNYIKRLVGKPNETIRIRKGDLWVRLPGSDAFAIQRKPPSVQRDIQLTVHDDRYAPEELLNAGWPERWEPSTNGEGSNSVGGWVPAQNDWTPDREMRRYACDANGSELQWLRYRHFQPNKDDWQTVGTNLASDPQATLVADFCSFNAYSPGFPGSTYWVGDLTMHADVTVDSVGDDANMVLELVEGPLTFQCHINLQTGIATLLRKELSGEDESLVASGETDISGEGSWRVSFANVDDRVCLWIDGDLVEFDQPTEYESSDIPQPTFRDLSPCGLAFANAKVSAENFLIERDIYYRNDIIAFDQNESISLLPDYSSNVQHDEVPHGYKLESQLHDPDAWAKTYAEESAMQLRNYGRYGEYELASDEYLMFGDNSSMSKDSRLFDFYARPMNGVFSHRYAVREKDLIGKALFIFWPHGVPFLNGGEGIAMRYHVPSRIHDSENRDDAENYPSVRIPFYPNVARMKKIR